MPVQPKHAAQALQRIADLIELHGENVHRARAFANASRTIRRIEGDLEALVRTGEILKIRGIGRGTAEVLEDLVSAQRPRALTELEERTPAGLLDLLGIAGLGPKKVRTLWQELGIVSVGELAYACRENRLVELKGFGAASQARVSESLGFFMRSRDLHLLSRAHEVAGQLYRHLETALAMPASAARIEITGALRRGAETIGCIEALVSWAGPYPDDSTTRLAEALGRLQTSEPFDPIRAEPRGLLSGTQGKGTIGSCQGSLDGIRCKIHLAAPGRWGLALLETTGDDAHLERLRQLAEASGVEGGPGGLARDGVPLSIEREEELYAALGCQWVPPELREDPADLERAARQALPELVRAEDLLGALHNHTRDSDGSASLEEMAASAARLGWRFLGIADHSPMAHYANGVDCARLRDQWLRIDSWNRSEQGPRLLKGLEADITTSGSLDIPAGCEAGLDYVVASVHSAFRLSADRQTERLLSAVRHPSCTILGHPTGRLRLARPGYELDLDRVLEACAERGVAVEINASPYRLDLGSRAARRALELGVRLAINPDAHDQQGLTDLQWGLQVARRAGARRSDVINCEENAGLASSGR